MPEETIPTKTESSQTGDSFSYRLVISGLIIILLVAVGGLFACAMLGKTPPDGITQLASAALGGVVGILTPIRTESK